jgi:hypothetical protein
MPRPAPQKEEPKQEPPKEEPKQDPKTPRKGPTGTGFPSGLGKGPIGGAPKAGALRKYDEVITKDAKTSPGVFAVHRIDDRVYFEVPADKLGKLLMVRAEVAKGSGGGSFNGDELGKKFVRLERRENKIFVILAGFAKRGDKSVEAAIEAAATEPIIASFNVECEGKDRSAVIQVSQVFLADTLGVGGRSGGVDPDKSYLADVKAFPTNIEARAMLTSRGGAPAGIPEDLPTPGRFGGAGSGPRTTLVHYSIVLLPEEPMKPRFFDPRVGYFTEGYTTFSGPQMWTTQQQLITRFRLEKKDPTADVSEPVKPIVFYLAPEVPERYREFMKKGVEDWKPAFEKAGFKNAIVCKDPPTRAEDPNWDPEDARFNVIRWVAEPVANAMGPHVHDPRSGEIISAHILMYHDILKIVHLWYFVQCSAVDDRARRFPFADELTGELIRYVVAHEVGHTLGLRHNHRASQAYSIDQLRDPKFLEKNGNVASIMSYGRYNYVAQPEDKVPVKNLIPKLAPYDYFAIEWGYKPLLSASSPEAEKGTLDDWAARQLKEPFLRFGGEDGPSQVDPTVLTENIGNDPVQATALGLKNVDRVLGYLIASTTAKGEDFEILQDAYGAILTHRSNWLNAVLKQVGGVIENRTLGGRGEQFSRVSKEKQQEAVKFLLENAFTTPTKLLDPSVVNLFKFSGFDSRTGRTTGVADDVMRQQGMMLRSLLSAGRLNRLLDGEVLNPETAYTVGELLTEVQAGLWSELAADAPKVDPLRRNLQRTYVEVLKGEFEAKEPAAAPTGPPTRRGGLGGGEGPTRTSELRANARIALKELHKQVAAALPKVKDPATKAHLQDTLEEIEAVTENGNGKK